MEDTIPGAVSAPQASAPAPTAAPADTTDWKARYVGLSQTLTTKDTLITGLTGERDSLKTSFDALQGQFTNLQTSSAAVLTERDTLASTKTDLESQLATATQTIEKMKLFMEFPTLAPFMENIQLSGTPEQQRATLAAMAGSAAQQAQAAADAARQEAQAGVTAAPKPAGTSPQQEIARLQELAYTKMIEGDTAASDAAMTEYLALQAEHGLGSAQAVPSYHPSMFQVRAGSGSSE